MWLRIRTSGWVDPRWLLALSALDLAALVVTTSLSRGFDSRYFPMYYFGVAVFAWLFTSPYLVFSWTTLVGGVYVALCVSVGDGVDLAQQDEKAIFYRVLSMYGVASVGQSDQVRACAWSEGGEEGRGIEPPAH